MYHDETILKIKFSERNMFDTALNNLFCLYPDLLRSYNNDSFQTYDPYLKRIWKKEYKSLIVGNTLQFNTKADKIAFLLKWSQ